ncbi:hypothetical protein GCM10009804_58370 [Kribbella hippodromi]|uniref:SLC26A/SulP transporter domain-containing protein n=1 Tax=Kribbella hippodromi TaxID=434347 RepID=A0ABN2E5J0_9ACTN
MTGLALLLFALIRIGWVVDAISDVVITGLKIGVGLTIVAEQLPDLLGIEPAEGGFIRTVAHAAAGLGAANGATMLVAASPSA